MIWPHFTKEKPCPSCNHFDWNCRGGERKYICMRVQSSHPSKDGGWFHNYSDEIRPYLPPAKPAFKPCRNIKEIWDGLECSHDEAVSFANKLGVSIESLTALQCARRGAAWAIPMRDGDNEIIGIHLRCDDGTKRAVVGSRNGLFCPQVEAQELVLLPEGASNVAALVTMGFYAIGRPSCCAGAEQIKVALERLGVRRAMIIGDADEIKFGGKRPGYAGAMKLKSELGIKSSIWFPPNPLKDVRQLLNKVGAETARAILLSDINGKVWTK